MLVVSGAICHADDCVIISNPSVIGVRGCLLTDDVFV
jgi:hypothetical protein